MGNQEKSLTFRLFARPSFISGIAQIFDFSGSMLHYNRDQSGAEADYHALNSDWKMVGRDIQTALEGYDKSTDKAR